MCNLSDPLGRRMAAHWLWASSKSAQSPRGRSPKASVSTRAPSGSWHRRRIFASYERGAERMSSRYESRRLSSELKSVRSRDELPPRPGPPLMFDRARLLFLVDVPDLLAKRPMYLFHVMDLVVLFL